METDIEKKAAEEVKQRFEEANKKSQDIIEAFMTGGFMDTFAKLLVYVGQERAADILNKMGEPDKTKLTNAYNAMQDKKTTDPDVVSEAGHVLKNAGFYGEAAADEVLKGLNYQQTVAAAKTVSQMFDINPLLAMNVEQNIVCFEMLADLGDRDFQKLLREVDQTDLTRALIDAPDSIQRKTFVNVSRRVADIIREDMDFMGPVRQEDILEARQKIVNTALRLIKNGDMVLVSSLHL